MSPSAICSSYRELPPLFRQVNPTPPKYRKADRMKPHERALREFFSLLQRSQPMRSKKAALARCDEEIARWRRANPDAQFLHDLPEGMEEKFA